MKIYTKAGDSGKTTFGCCEINKNDPLAEAIGTVDELNSHLGLALSQVKNGEIKNLLLKTQHDLFVLGAELYGAENQQIGKQHIQILENFIDLNQELLPRQFILPGGSLGASELHVARAVCRRAERNLVSIQPSQTIIKFINRLSDCLFVMALKENHACHVEETFFSR